MVSSTHKVFDGGLESLEKKLKKLKSTKGVQVGIFQDQKYPKTGASLIEVALVHEHGSQKQNIPKRAVLIPTALKNKKEISTKFSIAAKKVLGGSDPQIENAKIASWFSGEVKKTIREGGYPFTPNTPATIARKKGNNTPLRESGLFMKSITWQQE